MTEKEQLQWKLKELEDIREQLLGRGPHSSIRTVLNGKIRQVVIDLIKLDAPVEVVEG